MTVFELKVYDANGVQKASGVNSISFAANPTSVFDASAVNTAGAYALTLSMDNQSANTVLAGATSGGATTPAFRALVNDDIPNISAAKITSGELGVANGGSGADLSATGGSNQFVKQTSAGGDFTVAAISAGDITTPLVSPPPIGTTTPNTGYFSALRLLIGGFFAIFTHANSADRTYTLPNATTTLVGTDTAQTLTNKTIGVSQLSGQVAVANGGTALSSTPTNGQLLIGNGTNYTLAAITAGTGISVTNGAGSITVAQSNKYAIIGEEQANNTAGGSSTATTWTPRVINTETLDPSSIVSIASNQFTLVSGTYRVHGASEFAGSTGGGSTVRLRLRNATAGSTVISGVNYGMVTSGFAVAEVDGIITSNGTDAYELQYWVSASRATIGLGAAANEGTNEIYTRIFIEQIG